MAWRLGEEMDLTHKAEFRSSIEDDAAIERDGEFWETTKCGELVPNRPKRTWKGVDCPDCLRWKPAVSMIKYIFIILILFSSTAFARFKFKSSFDITEISNGSKTREMESETELQIYFTDDILELGYTYEYGKVNDIRIRAFHEGLINFEKRIEKRHAALVGLNYTTNRFVGVENTYSANIAHVYYIAEDKSNFLKSVSGVELEYIDTAGIYEHSVMPYISLQNSIKVLDSIIIESEFKYKTDLSSSIYKADVGFEFYVLSFTGIELKFSYIHDTDPVDGYAKNYFKYRASAIIKI